MAKCKSCEAEILWITTQNNKQHPVDAKPVKMWVPDRCGPTKMMMIEVYQSHFATCPDADAHRKTKENEGSLTEKLLAKIGELESEITRLKHKKGQV